jgi:hypothetical protein
LQLTQDDDLSFLKPFYRSRLLSLVRAKALVRGRSDRNTHRRYFEAADPMLVLRNSLTYLQTLWACERRAGKLQNKIPQHVSQFFGVKRLSLPDIGFVMDILSLGHAGVVGVNKWSRNKDTLGLGLLLNVGTREPADIPMLLNNLRSHSLLTGDRVEEISQRWKRRNRDLGQFDTGRYFNIARLIDRSAIPDFSPYYWAIDNNRLWNVITRHYRSIDQEFVRQLRKFRRQHPKEFSGVRIRDLSNALFFIWWQQGHGRYPYEGLPIVAQYTLGAKEFDPTVREPDTPPRWSRKTPTKEPATPRRPPIGEAFLSV